MGASILGGIEGWQPWEPVAHHPNCSLLAWPAAGATSAALKKNNSGLTKKLSGFASFAALALGATMLLGGFGVELPFTLPFGLGHDH